MNDHTARIEIRVFSDDRDRWQQAADRAGMTLSAWMRQALNGAVSVEDSEAIKRNVWDSIPLEDLPAATASHCARCYAEGFTACQCYPLKAEVAR